MPRGPKISNLWTSSAVAIPTVALVVVKKYGSLPEERRSSRDIHSLESAPPV
jgi:hypothetical protein